MQLKTMKMQKILEKKMENQKRDDVANVCISKS